MKINLLTVNERPLFPGGVTTLVISRDEEIHLIEQLAKSNRPFGVVLTRLRSPEDMAAPLFPGIYQVGTLCRVNRFVRLPNGTLHVFVNTLSSFFIEKVEKNGELLEAIIRDKRDIEINPRFVAPYMRLLKKTLSELLPQSPIFAFATDVGTPAADTRG